MKLCKFYIFFYYAPTYVSAHMFHFSIQHIKKKILQFIKKTKPNKPPMVPTTLQTTTTHTSPRHIKTHHHHYHNPPQSQTYH